MAATRRQAQNHVRQICGRTAWVPHPRDVKCVQGVPAGFLKLGVSILRTVQQATQSPHALSAKTGPSNMVSRSVSACIGAGGALAPIGTQESGAFDAGARLMTSRQPGPPKPGE